MFEGITFTGVFVARLLERVRLQVWTNKHWWSIYTVVEALWLATSLKRYRPHVHFSWDKRARFIVGSLQMDVSQITFLKGPWRYHVCQYLVESPRMWPKWGLWLHYTWRRQQRQEQRPNKMRKFSSETIEVDKLVLPDTSPCKQLEGDWSNRNWQSKDYVQKGARWQSHKFCAGPTIFIYFWSSVNSGACQVSESTCNFYIFADNSFMGKPLDRGHKHRMCT